MIRNLLLCPAFCLLVNSALVAKAEGPLVWYRYGTTGPAAVLEDVSGNAHHATASGSEFSEEHPLDANLTAEVPSTAGSLVVSGQENSGGRSNSANLLTNAAIEANGGFTMETWFRRAAANNASGGVQKLLQVEIENFFIRTDSDFVEFSDGVNPPISIAAAAVGEWHHVAAVFDSQGNDVVSGALTGKLSLYFDGVPVLSDQPLVLSALRDTASNPIYIGRANVPTESFAGELFETRVSLGALSRDELLYNAPPVANAGMDRVVESAGPLTEVTLDGTGSADLDGSLLEYLWSAPEGVILNAPNDSTTSGLFPLGTSELTLQVTDADGATSYDSVIITVTDTISPTVTCTTDIGVLWPPDHKMRSIRIFVQAGDADQNLDVTCAVTSNEPDDGTGDGEFTGDVNFEDGFTGPVPVPLVYDAVLGGYTGELFLRAERDGGGTGRIYSVACNVEDSSGNAAQAATVVIVPHDRRKK